MIENKRADISNAIKKIFSDLMDDTLNKVLHKDPFIKEDHRSTKPLYAALVPDEIFKGSHFERRFVTPFGAVWEKLAEAVALLHHKDCKRGYTINGKISKESLRRIQEVLNKLEHKSGGNNEAKVKPDWESEIKYIKDGGGELVTTSVVCDIFIDSKLTGKKYAFELKAPMPNSDQTKVTKEKLFKLLAMEPQQTDYAIFALVYNPYGKRENYNWSVPFRWFDMHTDPSVLIGEEFWDLIGGSGTLDLFLKEANLLGKGYKHRIYSEFLGVTPPENYADGDYK